MCSRETFSNPWQKSLSKSSPTYCGIHCENPLINQRVIPQKVQNVCLTRKSETKQNSQFLRLFLIIKGLPNKSYCHSKYPMKLPLAKDVDE